MKKKTKKTSTKLRRLAKKSSRGRASEKGLRKGARTGKNLKKAGIFHENWVNIPNILSGSRVLMVGPFIYYAHMQGTEGNAIFPLIAIILFMGLTDLLDGLIARKFGMITTLGAYLDPIADKLVIAVSLVTMVFYFDFPIWILVIYLLREIIMVYLSAILWQKKVKSVPNRWGKWAMGLMIALLPIFLLRYSLVDQYAMLDWIAEIFAYGWFTCYFLSGINYWQQFGDKLIQK